MSNQRGAANDNTDRIVWVDVETTGLNAQADYLLEIAVLVTDTDLNLLDEDGLHRVIYYPQDMVQQMRQTADPYVWAMHTRTGLWDALSQSTTNIEQVDDDVLAYIKRFAPETRQARVGGNSVRLDLNFLDEWLPQTSSHIHYRFFDVTTLATAMLWWKGSEPDKPVSEHTAMGDIRASLDQARAIKAMIIGS